MPINQFVGGVTIIMTAFYFQIVSKSILYLEYFHFALIIGLLTYTIIYIPESPKYLIAKKEYDKARDSFEVVARFNKV